MLAYCRVFVWPLFVLTVLAYVAWFGYAAALHSLGTVTQALLDVVLARDVGTSSYVKKELFVTLPGLTTITQCGILYVTIEALLWVRGASDRRLALARLAMVLGLALVRALLLSERLALVELAIPIAVVFATIGPISKLAYRGLIRLAPVFAGVGVFGVFAVGEYFRSWNFYQSIYSGPYLRFAAERFLGYYATAVNNGAVIYYYEPIQPLRYTFQSLLEFPILGDIVYSFYARTFGEDYIDYTLLLETYANPEFNNTALVGLLLSEYSCVSGPSRRVLARTPLGDAVQQFPQRPARRDPPLPELLCGSTGDLTHLLLVRRAVLPYPGFLTTLAPPLQDNEGPSRRLFLRKGSAENRRVC